MNSLTHPTLQKNTLKFYKIHGIRALIYYQDRLLILKRSAKDKDDPHLWDLPGGAIQPGETFFEAIKREVLEETGIKVSLSSIKDLAGFILGKFGKSKLIIAVFILSITTSKIKLNTEHSHYRWIPPEKLSSFKLGRVLKAIQQLNQM